MARKIEDVYDIVCDWLESHGYDGLYCPGECACKLSDLAPCSEMSQDCQPGYVVGCTSECDHFIDEYEEGDWHVQGTKPAPTGEE